MTSRLPLIATLKLSRWWLSGWLILLPAMAFSAEKDLANHTPTRFDLCVYAKLLNASDTTSVGQLREQCQHTKTPLKPLTQRRLSEVITERNPFVITPHRLNYALLGYYAPRINQAPFEQANPGTPLHYENAELQFQISFKIPLAKDVGYEGVDLYAAYTNRSFWQFFDEKDSIPFRETNHEPELWAEFNTDMNVGIFNLHKLLLGINHQSNGQSGTLSRGWNRVFLQGLMQKDNGYISFKTWHRFDEQDEFDNSFNYPKYLGDYEVEFGYRSQKHTYGITFRNQYRLNEYGSFKLDYTYPLTKKLKGYVQWFHGYGDSLIDMEYHSDKLGIGIVLGDRF